MSKYPTIIFVFIFIITSNIYSQNKIAFAYIANRNSGTVSVINTNTNTVTATVAVSGNPEGVSVSPDNTRVYITHFGGNTVTVLNTATNTVLANIGVGNWPLGICVSPNGKNVYVVNNKDSTVSVINTLTNTVTATIKVGSKPSGICISPDGSKVYVTNYGDNTVSVFNTFTNLITTKIQVGSNPFGIAITPDGTKVYVSNQQSNNVSVISTSSYKVTSTVAVGSTPMGVCVSPDGSVVYVVNTGTTNVSVISTTTNTAFQTLYAKTGALGVSVTPDGTRVYVTNEYDTTVSAINVSKNTVLSNIKVGLGPFSIGNFIANVQFPPPIINSFTPIIATPGTIDTIKGSGFTGATSVSFGGTSANSYTVVNDSTITAFVGNGTSGNIQVVSTGGTASLGGFIYCLPTKATITEIVCKSYLWHGKTYTTSGTYTFDSLNKNGCDSLTTLNLIINKPTTATINKIAYCYYTWHGTIYTTSGTYTFDSLNSKGCDSLTTLKLAVVLKPTTATIIKTANCYYTWHGTTYTTSGTYTFDSLNTNGCDSLTTLKLTIVLKPTTATIFKKANCYYIWHGTKYTTSGKYTFDTLNLIGCDSLVTLNLTINNVTFGTFIVKSCNSYTWAAKGNKVYTTSNNTDTIHLTNVNGCDSLVTLNLTIDTGTYSTFTVIACDSYTWVAKGNKVYTTSNKTDTIHLINVNGCDSLVTLNLTINTGTHNITKQTVANNYTWKWHNYTTSGTYTYSYNNSNGCASVDTLNLIVYSTTTSCFKDISAGARHTIAIKNDGSLWAWGYNHNGQLGDGTRSDKSTPMQIGTATNWASISASMANTLAIKNDGSLWAWGDNSSGQLGNGTFGPSNSRNSPVQIGIETNWSSICASVEHTIAIKTDGSLWAWGINSSGQLGVGTTAPFSDSPVQIGTATNWASISASNSHNIAIKTDGSLWAWGNNSYGQLGVGDTYDRNSPVQVGTATNWASISSGDAHTLAIKNDGSLWAWGENVFGQLGVGDTSNRNSPVQVGTATNWGSISSGSGHNIATKTDGSLWAWGYNYYGQLGDGTRSDKSTPMQIGIETNWSSICTSDEHTIAIKTDGSLWAWGWNSNGQLGDGSITDKYIPTQISRVGCVFCGITQANFEVSACDSYTWVAKGNKVYTASNYTDTIHLTNINGCDSLVTLNLTIEPITPTIDTLIVYGCNNVIYRGNNYTISTIVRDTIKSYQGCDSIYNLAIVNINNITPTTNNITLTSCDSITYKGIVYYAKTILIDTLKSYQGCDSVYETVNISIKNNNISGNIQHPSKGNVIQNVSVYYSGTINGNSIGTGNYNFSCLPNSTNETIKLFKNNDLSKTNGVTALDIALVQSHILGKSQLNSPYKLIAADVNGDGKVTALDIVYIKRLVLGIDTTFTNTTTKQIRLWAFVDSSYKFPDTTNPFPYKDSISYTGLSASKTNQTFIGCKLGDVNWDWNPAIPKPMVNNKNAIELSYSSDVSKGSDRYIRIPIKVKNFKDMLGMQFTLNFNPTELQWQGFENNPLGIETGTNHAAEGSVSFLWVDPKNDIKTLEDGSVLMELVFKIINPLNNVTLDLNGSVTPIVAYDKDYNLHSILLKHLQQNISESAIQQFTIKPNPSKDHIAIKGSNIKILKLIDNLGRVIKTINVVSDNTVININGLSNGLYFVQATYTNGNIQTQKLVKE